MKWAGKMFSLEKLGDVRIETKMVHGFIQQTRLEECVRSGKTKIMNHGRSCKQVESQIYLS